MCSYVKCPVMLMKNIWNKDKFPGFEDVLARVISDVATKRTILCYINITCITSEYFKILKIEFHN